MSDDLVKRLRYALHDMQGRVEASKLGMFEKAIDRIATLSARVTELDRLTENLRAIERNVQAERERQFQRAERAEAALATARDGAMEAAALVADDYHEKALAWAKNIRGLDQHLGETDSSRIAAAIRAMKGGAA